MLHHIVNRFRGSVTGFGSARVLPNDAAHNGAIFASTETFGTCLCHLAFKQLAFTLMVGSKIVKHYAHNSWLTSVFLSSALIHK